MKNEVVITRRGIPVDVLFLTSNVKPIKGDKKTFFGKLFIYSGHSWGLDEICKDVISPKNVENSGYKIHSYSL